MRLQMEKGSYHILGDQGHLERALMNVIHNAWDAMPEGGELVCTLSNVTLDETQALPAPDLSPGDWICLQIRDEGEGIDPSIQDKVFDPFFTTKEFGLGNGLGLSQTYGIVRQHHGAIALESQPGHGTTLSLYLPPPAASAT